MNSSDLLMKQFRKKLGFQSDLSRHKNSQSIEPKGLEGLYTPPENALKEPKSCFPLQWYRRFLEEIRKRKIEILTYDDLLADCKDRDYKNGYSREFRSWYLRTLADRFMRRIKRKEDRAFLLIQHDVDSLPLYTKRMVAMEAEYGIRSNIFIFCEKYYRVPNRRAYELDFEFFQQAERAGFVVGYHQNALQLAGFDIESAKKRFYEDVMNLRKHFAIKYFCPHGGVGRSVNGKTLYNNDVPVPKELEDSIQWVYNKYGMYYSGRWSDGGIRSISDINRLRGLDIIEEFVKKMKPGKRYFALIHPQRWGYNIDMSFNPLLAQQPWYQQVCKDYEIK